MQCCRHILIRPLPTRPFSSNISHQLIHAPVQFAFSNRTRHASSSTTNPPFPFPVITTCPDPTCPCTTPAPPDNLNIDTTRPLTNTIAPYTQHVLVSTGRSDWKSRIEDEIVNENASDGNASGHWGSFIHDLKYALGPKGPYHSPYDNVLVTASSFVAQREGKPEADEIEALLFPAFQQVRLRGTGDPALKEGTVKGFVEGYLRHKSSNKVAGGHGSRGRERQSPSNTGPSLSTTEITTPTILICGHMSRDSRCGVLGPLLRDEFAAQLERKGFQVHTEGFDAGGDKANDPTKASINIGLISHIGGHRWAGNVIMYIPPSYIPPALATNSMQPSPLSGTGLWYGRVAPQHVQGILDETLLKGNIIRELFRGVVGDAGRGVMRL